MKRLVLATRNEGKIQEVLQLLTGLDIEVVDLNAYPDAPQVPEEGRTFAENAREKATAVARHTKEWVLADDSGLEVDALHGAPGVHSARYAGHHGDDEGNIKKLIGELRDVPGDRRMARFVCALALASPDGKFFTAEGECRGQIGYSAKGINGFGYDPVFFMPGFGRMMAELLPEDKNRVSHRGRALNKIRPFIIENLAKA